MGRPRKIIEPGELTDRQQEVLALLAKGRTNAEIGEALGISLDGAKWHVSEIISRLGVDSREQAADYWRERQRLPQRVGRRLTAPAWLTGMKLAGTVAGAIAAIGVVAAVLLLVRGGDDDAAIAPDETSAASSSTSIATTDTPASSPTADDGRIATYNGLPVYEITVAPPVTLPAGTVLYYSQMCGVCIGGELVRARLDSSGTWATETVKIYDSRGRDGYALGEPYSNGRATLATFWCLPVDGIGCGKRHDGSPNPSRQAVLLSNDGGRTWHTLCDVGPDCGLAGVYGTEAIIADGSGGLRLLPSGTPFATLASNQAGRTIEDWNGMIVRTEFPGLLALANLASGNSTLVQYSMPGAQPASYLVFPGGSVYLTFAADGELFTQSSRSLKAYEGPPLRVGPAIVDIAARTIAPIAGITSDDDFISPVAVLYGPTLRVVTGNDCLNVRDSPSTTGASLDCLPHGEYVRATGKTQANGGVEWVSVEMLDGRPGWVAKEFVE